MNAQHSIAFRKMHGLGNDFVVIDGRQSPVSLDKQHTMALSDRREGIGCDQLITLSPSQNADVKMRIHNADGSEAEACGNATRCIASIIFREKSTTTATIETAVGILKCEATPLGVKANLGEPRFDWQAIPLSENRNTDNLELTFGNLTDPSAVNMGNPHVVFFVDDLDAVDLPSLGPMIETYPLFPERVNVNVAQILSPSSMKLNVWERGAGITRACGTGAAATLVAAHKKGLVDKECKITLPGGDLVVHWQDDNSVTITGEIATSFEGVFTFDGVNCESIAS